MSDAQTPQTPEERPPVVEQSPEPVALEVVALEEQLRVAAEQTAGLQNTIKEQADQIFAMHTENADLRKANEEYQKEVDSRWDVELKKATKKIEAKLIADGKLAVHAVEGEAVVLAKDVRSVILEVRNGIQHFETQVHFDTILQKLGLK